jgi:4-amino-4-deoxy-L-arabinose transferase-like glycosyltransferase
MPLRKIEGDKSNLNNNLILNLKNIFTFNRILIIIILFGILLRINTFWTLPPTYDGNAYIAVGHNIPKTGEIMAPWGGDFGTGNSTDLEFSRLSPVFPSYLSVFYMIFGYSIAITQIAGIILGILTLLVIYLSTKSLFGHRKGLIVTAIMSVTWPLIIYPGMEWGDNMVIIFFVATLWAFLKGLQNSKYMIFFGLFSATLILTKVHGVHFLFGIAIVIGFFLWRYRFMGTKVFKDKYYYFGSAGFLFILLGWFIRNNLRMLKTTEQTAFSIAPSSPSIELLIMFALKFPYLLILAAVCFLFWWKELEITFKKIKKEDYNALWMFTIGFFLLIWVITALMGGVNIHDRDTVFRLNHIRYITPIYVSLLWLVAKDCDWTHQGKELNYFSKEILRETKKWIFRIFKNIKILFFIAAIILVGLIVLLEIEFFIGLTMIIAAPTLAIESTRKRLAVMLLVFIIVSINSATIVKVPPYISAAKDLQGLLEDGDSVMVDGEWHVPDKFALYPYLAEYDVKVMEYDENLNATYIFSYENKNYTGYALIGEYYWDGDLGLIINLRNDILGLIKSNDSGKNNQTLDPVPSGWLWEKE